MACTVYITNMVRTQIQFEKGTYEKLKARSKSTGNSISEIVRRALDRNMETEEFDQKWRRAAESLGKFSSGLQDLSEKHDQYLGDRW